MVDAVIPVLYSASETAFTTKGKGWLTEATSCIVTEELNGIYELEMTYPISGSLYMEMALNGGIIYCVHDDVGDPQAFEIYRYSAPIDGLVTFFAHHISYRLNKIVVQPFTATSCSDAVSKIATNSMQTNPFTFSTDKTVNTSFEVTEPRSARSLLGGVEGSLLDQYGGELKFDNFNVSLLTKRGSQAQARIMYGKNLTDMTKDYDKSDIYNAVVPYWKGGDGNVVWYNGTVVATGQTADNVIALDLSSYFSDPPTTAQLQAKAAQYLADNTPWIPNENITVQFYPMWQDESIVAFDRVNLGDTLSVEYIDLGVMNSSARVVKVSYNVLLERYESIEVGKLKTTLADALLKNVESNAKNVNERITAYVPSSGGTFTGNVTFNGSISGQGFADLLFGIGNTIASNTDCNSIQTEGKYTCPTSAVCGTLTNPPFTSAFGMLVLRVAEATRLVQIAMPNTTAATIKIRYYNGSWTAWKTLTPS